MNESMESTKQYSRRIQTLSEAIYTCDEAGYIKLWNKAASELWGREPVVGKDLYYGSWRMVAEGKPVDGAEIIIQRPDGSYRRVLQYSSPIFNMQGELAGAVNMLIDVTELNGK